MTDEFQLKLFMQLFPSEENLYLPPLPSLFNYIAHWSLLISDIEVHMKNLHIVQSRIQ